MPSDGIFVLPSGVADDIQAASSPGTLVAQLDKEENLALVVGFIPDRSPGRTDLQRDFVRTHYTRTAERDRVGRCHAAEAELHQLGMASAKRQVSLRWDAFKDRLRGRVRWRSSHTHYLTYAPDAVEDPHVPEWLGWGVDGDSAMLFYVDVVDEHRLPKDFLAPQWPVDLTSEKTIAVLGVGSIGSATANALSQYAIGSLDLVDPDRLLQHNLPRHVLDRRHIGRRKPYAMAAYLHEHRPGVEVTPRGLDIVADADQIRDLLPDWDVVVVSTDGVESRLAANWLTAAAGVPAIFACVLEGGALGELVISRRDRGCLLCHRTTMREEGNFDPEPRIDLEYGTGTAHRPMTAVGSDLALVGQLAAKAAVGTVLQGEGFRQQRLPGNHAAVALRPDRRFPSPFDDLDSAATRWTTFRQRDDCHVCNPET